MNSAPDELEGFLRGLLIAAANNEGSLTTRPIPEALVSRQGEMVEQLRAARVHFEISTHLGNLSLTIRWSAAVEAAAQRFLRGEASKNANSEIR